MPRNLHDVVWIVVADGAVARIFESDAKKNLREIEVLSHPETRLHGHDLETSRPGRSFQSGGFGNHPIDPDISPKHHEAQAFAKILAERLHAAANQGSYKRLFISANPSFLGDLRPWLPETVRKMVIGELDKDLTKLRLEEIKSHLPFLL
jgi:protein required for attachment to host cells